MNIEQAKSKMMEIVAKQNAYSQAMAMLHLDGATIAPPNSFEGRGRTLSFLSGEAYKAFISKETDELLDFLLDNTKDLDKITARLAEEGRKEYDKTSKIPIDEFMDFMKLQSDSNHIWEIAKKTNDFASFEPYLEKMVTTLKRFANYRNPEKKPYNLFLDDFETGYTMDDYNRFFKVLKDRVVPLIHDSIPKYKDVRVDFLKRTYPIDKQKILTEKLIDILKIDRNSFAWAESEHPFTMGINKKDVRFTTHFYETQFMSAVYSSIHEGGHATYELNTADELMYTTLDGGGSLGLHESQSRFYENIIGRSREFTTFLHPIISELFPEQFSDVTPEEFYNSVNKPEASLIRVEADELTYSLHVMVRYEIERMLFAGDINVSDLPGIWNEKYKEYLGIIPPNDAQGVLQDVHWSEAMFGYFPTYALGSAISSQLTSHMEKEFNYRNDVANGDLTRINAWMTDKVHKHGQLLKPKEIINYACKEDFDANYYCEYLIKKYSK